MASDNKLRRVLSLSAASLALLRSVVPAEGQSTEKNSGDGSVNTTGGITLKTDYLLLEPPHQKEIILLYADHTSHSSHASHSSHVSGADYYDSSTPDTTPSPPPETYTPPAPPVYTYTPPPSTPVDTNSSAPPSANAFFGTAPTNTISVTNSLAISETNNDTPFIITLKTEAAGGASDAQYTLALFYIHGEDGCETNIEKAKMLLELSAIQGNEDAKKRLQELDAAQNSGSGN